MRILVTGGAGFIGSHLSEALLWRGDEVVVLDDLSTGAQEKIRILDGRAGFRFVTGSVTDAGIVDGLVKGVDSVVHLAAVPGRSAAARLQANTEGTANILEAAARFNRPTIIATTSNHSSAEKDAADDAMAHRLAVERGIPVTVARFRNVVGPRQSIGYAKVLPRFVRQSLRGEDITVHGDGSQIRTFCYVDDVIEGMTALVDADNTAGGVYTFGSVEEIAIVELANRALEVTESSSNVVFVPPEDIAAYHQGGHANVPDISRAINDLGYEPRWALNDSLAAVAAAFLGRPIVKPTDLDAVQELLLLQEMTDLTSEDDAAQTPPPAKAAPPAATVQAPPAEAAPVTPVVPTPEESEIPVFDLGPVPVRFEAEVEVKRPIADDSFLMGGTGPAMPLKHFPPPPPPSPRPKKGRPFVSVIVPVYNEAPSIAECIRRLRSLDAIDELIVVNDGSDDGTGNELGRVTDMIDVLIDLPKNSGKGAAVKAGIARSRGEILVVHDSDLELDPADIPRLIRPIVDGEADVVTGNRMHDGNRDLVPPRQWVVNRLLTEFGNTVYGMFIHDIATGSRAIQRDLFNAMDPVSDRFEFDSELQAKAARIKARVVEIPITFRPRQRKQGKKVRWTDGVHAARALLKYRLWKPSVPWDSPTAIDMPAAVAGIKRHGPKVVFPDDMSPPPLNPPSRAAPGEAPAPPFVVPLYLRGGKIVRPESQPVRWDPDRTAGRETRS
ncbi:MAG: NAD-dependent epimerase/dehydratase family protein [Actinobacteria bacterium]|nr:NAD-dependent epimerase/dehydratase family protein [Actinomycetota bacterium]